MDSLAEDRRCLNMKTPFPSQLGDYPASQVIDPTAYPALGTAANATQDQINAAINGKLAGTMRCGRWVFGGSSGATAVTSGNGTDGSFLDYWWNGSAWQSRYRVAYWRPLTINGGDFRNSPIVLTPASSDATDYETMYTWRIMPVPTYDATNNRTTWRIAVARTEEAGRYQGTGWGESLIFNWILIS